MQKGGLKKQRTDGTKGKYQNKRNKLNYISNYIECMGLKHTNYKIKIITFV